MSEENRISRRQSLLGIGATGATLTGLAGCLGSDETASESDTKQTSKKKGDENGDDSEKKGALALEVVCHEKGEAELRVRNQATEAVEVDWQVTIDDLDLDDLDDDFDDDFDDFDDDDLDDLDDDLDDYDGNELKAVLAELLDDYDVDVEDLEGKQITLEGTTLTVGKRTIDLKAVAAKKGIDLDDAPIDLEKLSGSLTVPKGADETFWADVVTMDADVELSYDGKKVESVSIDAAGCEHDEDGKKKEDLIDVEAVCYRMRKVDIADVDDTQLENTYDSDVTGVTEDFDPDGEMIVDGEEVDEDDYDDLDDDFDDETDVLDESEFDGTDDLEGLEGVAKVREATFRVYNYGKEAAKVRWTVKKDAQGGKLTVEGKESATFTVTEHDDRKTFVTVTHDGKEVASVKPADEACTDDHDDDTHDHDDDNGYDDD